MSTIPEIRITALARHNNTVGADALVIGVAAGPDGAILLTNPLTEAAAQALTEFLGILGKSLLLHRTPVGF